MTSRWMCESGNLYLRILDSLSSPATVILTVTRFESEAGSILGEQTLQHVDVLYCGSSSSSSSSGKKQEQGWMVERRVAEEEVFETNVVWQGADE